MIFDNLPKSWKVVELNNLIEVETGKRAKGGGLNEGKIPSIGGEHLSRDGSILWNKNMKFIPNDLYDTLKQGKVKLGDILVVKDGATTGKVAFVENLPFEKVAVNEHVFIIRSKSKDKLFNEFLFYVLFSNIGQSQIKLRFHGMIGGIRKEEIRSLKIPLPPLHEQKKIAEILSTVDKAIQKVDEAIAKTERLKKGLMQELLTKGIGHEEFKDTPIGRIPKEWEVVRLGDTIKEIKNGFASGKRDENGIVQIRMNNVTTGGRLIFDSYLKVPVPDDIGNWILERGDFLFNNTNSYDLVGKSTIFNDAPFPCTFSNHFTRIRFRKELILPELVLYHFLILWRKGYFKSVAIRHVGQSAVHTRYLLKIKIPLPPLPEQQKIAEILSTVDKKLELERKRKEKLERIKKGLMNDLLSGRKRVKMK